MIKMKPFQTYPDLPELELVATGLIQANRELCKTDAPRVWQTHTLTGVVLLGREINLTIAYCGGFVEFRLDAPYDAPIEAVNMYAAAFPIYRYAARNNTIAQEIATRAQARLDYLRRLSKMCGG